MSVTIKSGVSSDIQTVGTTSKAAYVEVRDDLGNKVAKKQRDAIGSTDSALLTAGKNDGIAVMNRVDRKGNTLFGNYISEILESFEGATLNVQKWTAATGTFAQVQSTLGGFNFVDTPSTTSGAYSLLQSQRLIPKFPRVPIQLKSRLRHNLVAGTVADFGFGIPTTTTMIVPNGLAFRMTSSGTVKGVVTINSVEVAISDVLSTVGSNGNTVGQPLNMSNAYYTSGYFVYDIVADDDNIIFTIQDTLTNEIIGKLDLAVPKDQIKMWGATSLPIYYRVFNNTAPVASPIFVVTELQALTLDWNLQPDMSQMAASVGLSAGRHPYTGAQTENHTNSTAPASATLSNTAAGYTTLGGKFQFAAVAGAVTDFALFGYQVPAGSRFLCEGIHIETYNTGAAVATTASVLEWAMGFNSSAVSLATANIVRRQVGVQSLPIGAAIGATASPIDVNFVTPEVVESGRFLHVILNLPVGTATASQVIRGVVTIKGRFI